MPQAQPRQQPTLQDCQMLQHQIMLKQMQDLRKHQQFSELADGRQQNCLNQHSGMKKQVPSDPTLTHVSPENIFMAANMNLMPHGVSAAVQGFPNRSCSQAQTQDLHLMGLVPQQPEGSLFGTPVASSRINFNQHSHLQGLFPGNNNQAEKPAVQASYDKHFSGENCNISSELHSYTNGPFPSKQLLNGKNLFGTLQEKFQQMNSLQKNTTAQEFNMKPEQTGSSEQFRGNTTKVDPSQGVSHLDPLEQKILFNIDDNCWNSSFRGNVKVDPGGHTNTLGCSDYLSSFPSVQSGSWSALMQSAVAEASSTDTRVQEEWSGLNCQNTALSMDNQPSNDADHGRQQADWVDNNVTCLVGKQRGLFGASSMSPRYSGLQQLGLHFSNKQMEGTRSDSSHESAQQSPKVAAKWFDCKLQQGQPIRGSQPLHTIRPVDNAFLLQGISATGGSPLLQPPEAGNSDAAMAKSPDQNSVFPSFGSSLEPRLQQGNNDATPTTGSTRNVELQKSYLHAPVVATQSSRETSPSTTGKLPHFDLFNSRRASESVLVNRVDEQFPILESVPIESSRSSPCPWTFSSPQTRPLDTETQELAPDFLLSSDSTNTTLQTSSWIAQNLQGQNSFEENLSHESDAGLTRGFIYSGEHHGKRSSDQRGLYHGQDSVAKYLTEDNGFGSGSSMTHPHQLNFNKALASDKKMPYVSARDLEAFGRLLKPSNLHPNYTSTSERKHELVSVGGLSRPTYRNSHSTRDIDMPSLSPGGQDEQSVKLSSLPPCRSTAEEMGTQGLHLSNRDTSLTDLAFHKMDNFQVNLQMSPPCFKHSGTLKNGQMLQMYDRIAKSSMHLSPLGKHLENSDKKATTDPLNVNGALQTGSFWLNTATASAAVKSLPPESDDTDLSIERSKKRKHATSSLLPWHKEVTQSYKRLQSIRDAEMEWAKAMNRIVEKVDNEGESIEDVQPLLRLKNRLVLTTQLMQQVFMPAPTAFLTAKATLNYDSVIFFSAQLALGSACNLNSWSRNDAGVSRGCADVVTGKSRSSERVSDKHLSTIVEHFTSQTKKLEAEFQRLDKTASVVDVVVEFKELEKFSIINRFARFHVQRQQYAGQASTSSGPTLCSLKLNPRRYVDAFPMPKAVPERAQCLSL